MQEEDAGALEIKDWLKSPNLLRYLLCDLLPEDTSGSIRMVYSVRRSCN